MENMMSKKWNISWELNLSSEPRPKYYLQVIDLIRGEHEKGNYPLDFKMPTVRALATYLGIKRYSVERAYNYFIVLEEVLYTKTTKGTFMYELKTESEWDTNSPDLFLSRLPYNRENKPFFSFDGYPRLNILTLGNTYPGKQMKTCSKIAEAYCLSREEPETLGYGKYLLKEGFRILKQRKVLVQEAQLCIIPGGKALFYVLKGILSPGANIACVSGDDGVAMETFFQLQLKPHFTQADEEGMRVDTLKELCLQETISAVFLRPSPDIPIPICLTQKRWKQILDLAETYHFWIIVMNDEGEFSSLLPIDYALNTGRVIYISPFSKILPDYHNIGMVAGPVDFIERLNKLVKGCFLGWNSYLERGMVQLYNSDVVTEDVRMINSRAKKGRYVLESMFHNYFGREASLYLPDAGLFGFILFKTGIDPLFFTEFKNTELYHSEENSSFDPHQPINALRISLCIKEWKPLECVFKRIKGTF